MTTHTQPLKVHFADDDQFDVKVRKTSRRSKKSGSKARVIQLRIGSHLPYLVKVAPFCWEKNKN